MREQFLGEYIRQERLKRGITQEQLCAGICEPITVSRMENGKQTPSYSRICAFLQRLGLPDDRYFALLSKNEMEIKVLQDELRANSVRLDRATPENRSGICAEGLNKLKKLEELAEEDDHIIRQYILFMKSIFGKPDGPYSLENQLELRLQALHLTVPGLDLEEINLGLYSLEETSLLNAIACDYAQMGQLKKAIDIYRQLLKYVKKHCHNLSQYGKKFALIAHNYTHTLILDKRYDDALAIAELGWKVCVEYAHYQFLPGLLELLGECWFYKGDREKCIEYYRRAYYVYKAIGNERDCSLLEQSVKAQLGQGFPL